jgi:hypothetical protein
MLNLIPSNVFIFLATEMTQRSRITVGLLLIAIPLLAGCGRNDQQPTPTVEKKTAAETMPSPEQAPYLQAAGPFVQAIAHQRYEEAYALLSREAKSRMTLNQFVAPADVLAFQRNEQSPFMNVTPAEFVELMRRVEDLYGRPQTVESVSVFSLNPEVLSHSSKDASGILESATAIGGMPASIPNNIRRASVHVQIATQLTPGQLEHAATVMNADAEELHADPTFKSFFNVKLVLVEEDGQLKVAYFEFLPASRWT